MSMSTPIPTSFITSIAPITSDAASTSTSTPILTSSAYDFGTSVPQAPTAGYIWGPHSDDGGLSPVAIISIVAAVILLLLSIPLIAVIMRHYERKRLRETVKHSAWSGFASSKASSKTSSKSSLKDESLGRIVVTRELQRTSIKLAEGVDRPEPVYAHGREWSRTEVKGGGSLK